MKLYYASVMIQDSENSKPWLCSMQDSSTTIEDAKEIILKARKIFVYYLHGLIRMTVQIIKSQFSMNAM